MKEILTMGNLENDFKRLNVEIRETYKGEEYSVHEVTEEEFEMLCNESDDVADTWNNCGWRYCEGSNEKDPTEKILINGKEIIAWYDDSDDFDSEEEMELYLKDNGGVMPLEEFGDLLQYLCDELGCSQPRNVCALTKDLAKYNNMKLSELFKAYQG